jgi:hypothetical protein
VGVTIFVVVGSFVETISVELNVSIRAFPVLSFVLIVGIAFD